MCALLSLGWQLARQDHEVAAQRMQEQRESAADLAVAALGRALSQAQERLVGLAGGQPERIEQDAQRFAAGLPEDSVVIVAQNLRFDAYPSRRLPFCPASATAPSARNQALERAEDLEIRRADYRGAVAALESVARQADRSARATALLRLARVHKTHAEYPKALAAYRELSAMGPEPVPEADGVPADLIAAQARLALFEQQRDADSARREAQLLLQGLRQRRWRVTRGAYEFYASEALRALGDEAQPIDKMDAVALASVVASLPPDAQAAQSVLGEGDLQFLALRARQRDREVTAVLGPSWVTARLTAELGRLLAAQGIAITLTTPEGSVVAGPPRPDARLSTVRLAAATGLPWNVHAQSINPAAVLAASATRRRLLATGLGAVTILFLAGILLIGRAVSRDLAVSRQQSDFVAAVSHDFRTPLSSLCHLSEMLQAGRAGSESERTEYYGVLVRESQRLRRLVEGLLNFGRMEAGAMQYRFETVDPLEVVREVVGEFQRDVEPRGYCIQLRERDDTPLVRADRAAVACALWNLLDNAVKYSPECTTVWVEVGEGNGAVIRVRDRGIGIPPSEHGRIFERFVRGGSAAQAGVVGTGVGLALVRHIAVAHGGHITVESTPGNGATFTLALPA